MYLPGSCVPTLHVIFWFRSLLDVVPKLLVVGGTVVGGSVVAVTDVTQPVKCDIILGEQM